MTRETLADALEAVRDQRDSLYSMTVNPRRNAERALKNFDAGDMESARLYLLDVIEDLHGIPKSYTAYMEADPE